MLATKTSVVLVWGLARVWQVIAETLHRGLAHWAYIRALYCNANTGCGGLFHNWKVLNGWVWIPVDLTYRRASGISFPCICRTADWTDNLPLAKIDLNISVYRLDTTIENIVSLQWVLNCCHVVERSNNWGQGSIFNVRCLQKSNKRFLFLIHTKSVLTALLWKTMLGAELFNQLSDFVFCEGQNNNDSYLYI